MLLKSKEKKERSLGMKLFIKAERCNSPKCVMVRRPSRPGAHGAKRKKMLSDFGKQLQEKQKLQFSYGLNNKQTRTLLALKSLEKMMIALEHRLDRVVFLLGFAQSLRIARQLVSHGHIVVNDKKVTIPSFSVRIGDVISIRQESRKAKIFEDIQMRLSQYEPPEWLKINKGELKGECVAKVTANGKARFPFDINLVGEYYSR